MTKKELFSSVIDYFEKEMPVAETELKYKDPYQLLVAVILSAQCTDKRVNETTPALFKVFPNAKAMSLSFPEDIFPYIRSISYPNNKAKHLAGMAKMLVNDFKNIVPSDVDELQKLPGVGRKTANVIASVVYDKATMAVDTHVFRVAARIGLTINAKTPLQSGPRAGTGRVRAELWCSRSRGGVVLSRVRSGFRGSANTASRSGVWPRPSPRLPTALCSRWIRCAAERSPGARRTAPEAVRRRR